MAPDGNKPIQMEAARGGLCPGVNSKRRRIKFILKFECGHIFDERTVFC